MDAVAVMRKFPAGTIILNVGSAVRSVPIVKSGAVRIARLDDDGAELLLYYLEPGESCAATLSSSLGRKFSAVRVVAELDTELMLLPVERIDEWMLKYPSWRHFILRTFQERFDELLEAVDAVAFHSLEDRVLATLREKIALRGIGFVEATHQQLADELHTSRVVVSRVLKSLERQGLVRLLRNRIELS